MIEFKPWDKIGQKTFNYRLKINDKNSTHLIKLEKEDIEKLVNDLACYGFCIPRNGGN